MVIDNYYGDSMQINIRDFILDELDDNEISELLYAVVLRIRHNTLTKTFSNKAVKLAFSIVLSDMNDTQAAIEKKNKRAEINRQNALKRWGKSAGINGDAKTMQSHMQNLCEKNAIADANNTQEVSHELPNNKDTIQNGILIDVNSNANDMQKPMQNLCKSDAKVMQNNFAKHIDNKEENIVINNANEMQNVCETNANDNANKMQTEYENYANNKPNNTDPKSLKSLLDTFVQQRNELQTQKEETVFTEALNDEATAQNKQKADTNIEGMKSIGSVLKRINLPKIHTVENKSDSDTGSMQIECENNTIAYANGNAKFMQTECENYTNDMQNLCEDDTSDMQDNTQDDVADDVTTNIGNPFDIIREIERESKASIGNDTFKTEYEIYAESYAKKYNNNMQNVCERNANGYANEYANSYANEMQNYANDLQAAGNVNNSENTISASNLTSLSYASEKSIVTTVDDLLNESDVREDLSVQKNKEKEKRTKKEKENIYNNNIYNNKYIYNNNFKEEKENLIKEKEESKNTDNDNTCVNETEKKENTVSHQEKEKSVTQEEYKLSEQIEQKSKRFKAPTAEEVRAYILEKGYSVDAESFVDYYTSKGWVVGKSPMKDWKAAVRTWNKNHAKFNNTSTGNSYYANNRPNRMLTPNEKEAEEYADKLCQRLREKGVLTKDNKPVDYNEGKYKHG